VYLAIGWALWAWLTLLDPSYLFVLSGLYPQLFVVLLPQWSVLAALMLTAVTLWRETLLGGSLFWMSLGSGAGGVLIALFIQATIQQSLDRERLLRELEATRQQLIIASRQAGIMEERQRLAADIHDTLAQGLSIILMQLEAAAGLASAEAETLASHLAQARRTAGESLANVRRLLWALQPETFESISLPDAVMALADRWSAESGAAARVTVVGARQVLRPEIEVTLLRAAQEALANVRKHAQARQVTLTLTYMEDLVTLDAHDDGRGFEVAPFAASREESISDHGHTAGGFGLRALAARVERLGGSLALESTPGEGTDVAIVLPALRREPLVAPVEEENR
jgi:signal transduction histidine kinase